MRLQLRTPTWCVLALFTLLGLQGQDAQGTPYKKRVLEAAEVDFLSSYYQQDGENAAVTGGIGTESLSDATATIIVAIPLNTDDVLQIDAGISAYTSASSSNVNPFDSGPPDPYTASSGASQSDLWSNLVLRYSHNSEDRNRIWNAQFSAAVEYDYFSIGLGGGYSWLFNERNTEVSLKGNVYFDKWNAIYPIELRPFEPDGFGLNDALFALYPVSGNPNYDPDFEPFSKTHRNSYSLGLGFSQILSPRLQGSLSVDWVRQEGLLSTPFQRVYFEDVEDSFLGGFHLAEDVEHLPDIRQKLAAGTRLNYYLNASVVLRGSYRYYTDDWGITSHTTSLEVPVKVSPSFTLYPSYRYYQQTAADAFRPYNQHLSASAYYTSDFDLSGYTAHQLGFGVGYTDIFTRLHILDFGLKSIQLKAYHYSRDSPFSSFIITGGATFVMDAPGN
ncbi:DUF3570 domain-containing protein [Robiginitalea sp. M366]|uniref:DUF3570 domain-containing protein n=1 Tax=Robiginitalea aestuariiviva TaxID=3036903 RepID=UPI00240DEC54|nr:DUF3570 domain-containing protein [Robiginitalea aestuariiviva]MDG1571253.1 DUF3570 domain-containing protein [Robiginitalea aestuariiviva]